MGIYNSRGFNWKQYEGVPELTAVELFNGDKYIEITFREFATIIDLYRTHVKQGELDTLSLVINQEILKKLFSKEENVIELPYELKRISDMVDTNLQYVSPGLLMSMCLIFSIFYYGKQMAEIYGFKNKKNTSYYNGHPIGENCVFEIPSPNEKNEFTLISSIFKNNDNKLALQRITGVQNVYGRDISLDENHIYEQLKEFFYGMINYEDTEQLKKLIKCINPIESIKNIKEYLKVFFDSENDVKQVMENIRDKCWGLECKIAEKMFTAIMSKYTIERPQYWTIAIGDGSDTVSVLGIHQFGLLLFNYDYYIDPTISEVRTSKSHSITSVQIKKGDVLHIDSIGVENDTDVKCTLTINGLSPKTFDVLTTNKFYNTDDCFYHINSNNQQVIVAKLRKQTNDFYFYEDCYVDLNFTTNVNGREDAMFFISKIKDYRHTESIIYYNSFGSASFQMTQKQIRELYEANKDAFNDIVKKMRNGFSLSQNLTGEFVGKRASICPYSDRDIEADESYNLGYIKDSLLEDSNSSDDEYLRMSRVVITTDFKEKEILVNAVSHTSPRSVSLDINDFSNKFGKVSPNQILAMLRSMCVFEAVCFILYAMSKNTQKNTIKELLEKSFVVDETGTARGIESLNIKEQITYDKYKSYCHTNCGIEEFQLN